MTHQMILTRNRMPRRPQPCPDSNLCSHAIQSNHAQSHALRLAPGKHHGLCMVHQRRPQRSAPGRAWGRRLERLRPSGRRSAPSCPRSPPARPGSAARAAPCTPRSSSPGPSSTLQTRCACTQGTGSLLCTWQATYCFMSTAAVLPAVRYMRCAHVARAMSTAGQRQGCDLTTGMTQLMSVMLAYDFPKQPG